MGHDPDPKSFLANAVSLIEGGADILEVGIPFSDPVADGPVIQAAGMRASPLAPHLAGFSIQSGNSQHSLRYR